MTARHRRRQRSKVGLGLLICSWLALAAALVNVGVVSADNPCWAGVPAFKCDLTGPDAGPGNNPVDVSEPSPYYPSAALTDCGASFFDASTTLTLSNRFGATDCFRFGSLDQWIVLGDGGVDAGAAPGGAMIAVESCGGKAACLDPQAQHSFGDFTVFYPPDPSAWPMRLQTGLGDRLLYVGDGPCGVFTFDLQSLKWFGGSPAVIDGLMTGSPPAQVATPASMPGSIALTSPAPPSAGSCVPPGAQ
jgi:hypothetical protein